MRLWPIIPHKTKVAIDLWRSQPLWLYFITNKIILKPWCETHRGFWESSPTAWCRISWCLLPSWPLLRALQNEKALLRRHCASFIIHMFSYSSFTSMALSVGCEIWQASAALAKLRKRLSATMYFSCCNSYRYSVYIISQIQGLSCLERARFAPCILPLPSTYRLVYPIVLPAVLLHPLRRVGILWVSYLCLPPWEVCIG